MHPISSRPLKHILICVNDREKGDCCANVHGQEIYQEVKDFVKGNDLSSKIWVTRTRCLGFCNNIGTVMVIYPDELWFKHVTKNDVQKIKDFIVDAVKSSP